MSAPPRALPPSVFAGLFACPRRPLEAPVRPGLVLGGTASIGLRTLARRRARARDARGGRSDARDVRPAGDKVLR